MVKSSSGDNTVIAGQSTYDFAQEGLMSSLLYFPSQIVNVATLIRPEDFLNGKFRTIYQTLLALMNDNVEITLESVIVYLNSHGLLTQCGGESEVLRLFGLGARSASMSSINVYASTVKNFASLKDTLLPLQEDLRKSIVQEGANAKDIIESTRTQLDSALLGLATDKNTTQVSRDYGSYLSHVKEHMDLYRTTGDSVTSQGLPTGYPTFDKITGGLANGDMITVGAQTGVGKSFALTGMSLSVAIAGGSVLYFNLEMSPTEILDRLVANYSNVRLSGLTKGNLSDKEYNQVLAHREEFEKLNIEIETVGNNGSLTFEDIRARAQKKATSPEGLSAIFVDYLQLVSPSAGETGINREQQVASISRKLKMLAMELNIPVVVAVQLRRPAKKEEEEEMPSIYSIRESGSIAQDSSVILLLHRHKTDKDEDTRKEESPAEFIIAKNRHGQDNVHFKCYPQLRYAKFVEVSHGLDSSHVVDDKGNVVTVETNSSIPPVHNIALPDGSFTNNEELSSSVSVSDCAFDEDNTSPAGRVDSPREVNLDVEDMGDVF